MTVTCAAKPDDTVLLTVTLQAERCQRISLRAGEKTTTLYAGTQKTKVGIPLLGADLPVTLEGEGILSAVCENLGDTPMESLWETAGAWLQEDFQKTALPDLGAGLGAVKDMVKAGNRMVTVGAHGKMTVLDISDPKNPKICSEITGLGYNIRQIALCRSGEDVIITSREEGAYIINITDPCAPYIRSRYNSVELATGLSVSGDMAFIANRQFGMEAVDISDPDHPRHVGIIPTGEAQGCLVTGKLLYAGLWNQCRVDIFDVSDVTRPKKLGEAKLSGKGDGFTVCTLDGRTYLYAATGQHAACPAAGHEDPNFGMGGGLDIFDVTDPTDPLWLSTSRIDGRYYFPEHDDWRANVAVRDGRVYAYLVNTYNGVYVFDVTDPRRPVRLEHIYIPIPPESPRYEKQVFSAADVAVAFPFDQDEAVYGPVSRVFTEEGRIYLAGSLTDLHVADHGLAFPLYEPAAAEIEIPGENTAYLDPVALPGWQRIPAAGQTFAIEEFGGRLFVAAGCGGIAVYDLGLNLLKTHPTQGCCFDVFLRGDTLVASEGEGGCAAYRIEDAELREIWRYKSEYGICRSAKVSQTGKFAALEISDYVFELLNTETMEVLERRTGEFLLYNRTMLSDPTGRFIGYYRRPVEELWYDCGENDSFEKPQLAASLSGKTYSAYGGGCWTDGKILAFTALGYRLYDPFDGTDPKDIPLTKTEPKFSGKPKLCGKTLVVTNRMQQKIHVADCSDMTDLRHLTTVTLPGSPDAACIVGRTVYVPLGYMGLGKFEL